MAVFRSRSLLCASLEQVSRVARIELTVAVDNDQPLPLVFNAAIEAAAPEDILVFVHDDVRIDDWAVATRLVESLRHFDVVGVAGNMRRTPRQEAWCLMGDTRSHDLAYLSGAIRHGDGDGKVTNYGPVPREVKLLDGVFLAVRAATLQRTGVRFDVGFAFHFYDADFCRACELAGLRMGTWPIALTHRSAGGGWKSREWDEAYARYLSKWLV